MVSVQLAVDPERAEVARIHLQRLVQETLAAGDVLLGQTLDGGGHQLVRAGGRTGGTHGWASASFSGPSHGS